MKRVKRFIKGNIKLVVAFILGVIISGTGVYAAILYASSDVSYDNTSSGMSATNVQDALLIHLVSIVMMFLIFIVLSILLVMCIVMIIPIILIVLCILGVMLAAVNLVRIFSCLKYIFEKGIIFWSKKREIVNNFGLLYCNNLFIW